MIEEVVGSMSLNKILVALLEEHKTLSVPTSRFLKAANEDKELSVEYDEETLTFSFSLRSKDEQP